MKVGINGFGKVGQALLQRLASTAEIDVVAINEIELSVTQAAALLGSAASAAASGDLAYGHRTIKWLVQDDHCKMEWDTYDIEVVVEASRLFLRKEMVQQSADGRVVILMTGDLRDELPDLTLVLGVNDSLYRPSMTVLCAGSDRTQALVPILRVVHDQFGVKSYRACIHRPPYVGTCGRVQNRPTNAEQLARVLPALTGRGEVTRVDDPEATFVTSRGKLCRANSGAVASSLAAAKAGRRRNRAVLADGRSLKEDAADVVVFPNLGGDAVMVVPCPLTSPSA